MAGENQNDSGQSTAGESQASGGDTNNAGEQAAGSTAQAGDQQAAGQGDQGNQQSAGNGGDQSQADKGGEQQQADKGQQQGAPESYEAFTKPEGTNISDQAVSAFGEVAKDLNLTQEQAQNAFDKLAPAMLAHQQAEISAVRQKWADESIADQEFGGDKLNETLALAENVFNKYGNPAMSKMLTETGLGNHPEVIRMFSKIGKDMAPDGFLGTNQNAKGERDHATILFGGS